MKKARNFELCVNFDDYRIPEASPNGGIKLDDPELMAKLRKALKGLMVQIGRKIFSGDFDLSAVSYPIEGLSNRSVLDLLAGIARPISPYLNAAAVS